MKLQVLLAILSSFNKFEKKSFSWRFFFSFADTMKRHINKLTFKLLT